jgi:hypothetical protein
MNGPGVRQIQRLHGQQSHHLQQMVLNHIADGARFLVKFASSADAEILRHRDLHALHIIPVPDRLEERVGEAEKEEIRHGLFAQVVIDAKDLRLWEGFVKRRVQ